VLKTNKQKKSTSVWLIFLFENTLMHVCTPKTAEPSWS